ncbi:hypothetical protein D3C83_181300 [compost metagenome]
MLLDLLVEIRSLHPENFGGVLDVPIVLCQVMGQVAALSFVLELVKARRAGDQVIDSRSVRGLRPQEAPNVVARDRL